MTHSTFFHVLSKRDGGPGQRWALETLRSAGIPCVADHSPFIGHYGIRLKTRNQRLAKRATRLIYG